MNHEGEKSDDEQKNIDKEGKNKTVVDVKGTRRTISPYDITPNDNPGSLLTQVQLKGDQNYDEWSRSLRTALRARKKFGFVDGTIERPDEGSADLEDWWTNNSLLVSWIMNTIEPSLRSTMSHMEVAQDLWQDIKERFSVVNGPRIQQLKAELAECKQKGLTIVAYFGKLKKLWEEMANYEQFPVCKCGKCTCNLGVAFEKKREEEKVHQFLMGLDDVVYGMVRSNLLAQDPLPNLNKTYSTLVQEERVRTVVRGKEQQSEVMSFAVQAVKSRGKIDEKEKNDRCNHCNRTGHDVNNCFEVIGYPEWWSDRPRRTGRGSANGKGIQQGSSVSKGRGGFIKANTAHALVNKSNLSLEGEQSEVAGLSDEQWKTLLHLLNNATTSSTEKLSGMQWIIDTGASRHMTGRLDCLSDMKNIAHCQVGLPNGNHIAAVKEGTLVLSEKLKLTQVLYVPNLQCNLISVSQLIDESNCIVQFTNRFCIIQDHTSKMVIGAGEQREGLYYFKHAVVAATTTTINTPKSLTLWHQRLGHASFQVVEKIPNLCYDKQNNSCTQTRDVCLRAKQTRDVFPISNNKAMQNFQLIHCDVWGPYRTLAMCGARYFFTIVDDHSRAV
jgi:hypothetical protein